MSSPIDDGPTPGDPASAGPRPPATARDLAWAVAATMLTVVTGAQFAALTLALLRTDSPLSTGGMVLGFVVTVVWLLTISWLVLGCWRRSVWGCPFEHVPTALPARHCPRHHMTGDPPERAEG